MLRLWMRSKQCSTSKKTGKKSSATRCWIPQSVTLKCHTWMQCSCQSRRRELRSYHRQTCTPKVCLVRVISIVLSFQRQMKEKQGLEERRLWFNMRVLSRGQHPRLLGRSGCLMHMILEGLQTTGPVALVIRSARQGFQTRVRAEI